MVSVITAVLALFLGFFGGTTYQKSKTPANSPAVMGNRQLNGTGNGQGNTAKNGFRGGNAPVSGKIIKMDATSITVQTNDGSNKIVLLSDSTKVNKTAEAAKTDLKEGDEVMVIGSTDSTTGSVTATTINLGTTMLGRQDTNPSPAAK